MNHTPTPWSLLPGSPTTIIQQISTTDAVAVAYTNTTNGSDEDNALFILKACNLYEEMELALKVIAAGVPNSQAIARTVTAKVEA